MTIKLLKKLSVVIILICSYSHLSAQGNDVPPPQGQTEEKIYTTVEHHAYFPGGGDGFKEFLAKNLKYPALAKQQNIQGTVLTRVVVEKDGSLSEFKVLSSPGAVLSDEAIRIIKLSPKWGAGTQDSRPVRTYFTIPILFNLGNGQLEPPTEKEISSPPTGGTADKTFVAVEIQPSFPGGEAAYNDFLKKNIKYPPEAMHSGISGRVFLQFIVETDGSLSNITILRDPGYGLGEEAVRVIRLSPKWKYGVQNGRPVRVQFVVPINFSLAH